MPSANTTEAIDNLTVAMSGIDNTLILLALIVIPIALTVATFLSSQYMLGFPCAIFWMILGSYMYQQSAIPWGDWQYFMFIGSCLGMVPFTVFATLGIRKQSRSFVEEAEDIVKDEEFEDREIDIETLEPRNRGNGKRNMSTGIRARAQKRRAKANLSRALRGK